MKAEEFVKSKYPLAHARKFKTNGWNPNTYWLVWGDGGQNHRLSEGKTESNAWVNAKNRIIETESEQNK